MKEQKNERMKERMKERKYISKTGEEKYIGFLKNVIFLVCII